MQEKHYLVPQQTEGSEKNIAHSVIARSVEDAEDWFVDAKERLLDINNWEKYAKALTVEFRLCDGHGKVIKRRARRGDHIRIDTPGQGNGVLGGFDWATIEAVEYDDYPDESMETFALRIRPSENPQFKNGHEPAAIDGNDASSTIVIARQGNKLYSTYHGRNELAYSYAGHNDIVDNEADACWLGQSDIQWAELMKGLLM